MNTVSLASVSSRIGIAVSDVQRAGVIRVARSNKAAVSSAPFPLQLPLQKDIEELFHDDECVRGLAYRFERTSSPGMLADIQDGKVYSTLMRSFLRHPHNLALAFNTDGVTPFKSSTYQLWPIYWQCLDLPPRLRFTTKFTRIAGL